MLAECRVRKLRIRTDDRATLPRITFLLEDAFRTASFPGIPTNGMVYIKRLDLGRNMSTVTSRVLSRRIDDLVRNLRPVKITDTTPEHPVATAVWFADDLEPYRLLSILLSQNHRPLSWYWPAAIKGWSPQLTIKQSFQLIVTQVLQKPTGIKGLSCLLKPLLKRNLLLDMLNTIEPMQVSHWVLNLGLQPGLDKRVLIKAEKPTGEFANTSAPGFHIFPQEWKDVVGKALTMWSLADPRTVFTTYIALADNSGHAVNSTQAISLLHEIVKNNDRLHRTSSDSNVTNYENRKKDNIRTLSAAKVDGDHLRHNKETQAGLLHIDGKEQRGQPMVVVKTDGWQQTKEEHMSQVRADKTDGTAKIPQSRDSKTYNIQQTKKKQKKQSLVSESDYDTSNKEPPWPKQSLFITEFAGERSHFAGLPFLILVMKRLGIETLLAHYPEYYGLRFAERIFWRVASLLHIPLHDPILRFLWEEPPDTSPQQIEFVAPMHWRPILTTSKSENLNLRLCRVTGMPGHRLILDNKDRLVVGLWYTQNREFVNPWLAYVKGRLKSSEPKMWSVEKAVDNFVIAMCRYIRRYAKMNLRSLVQRPAYAAITRTHMDITIPLQQLDIRVRLAGLDIDPGWVPWLGRVIQFHYIEDEG